LHLEAAAHCILVPRLNHRNEIRWAAASRGARCEFA